MSKGPIMLAQGVIGAQEATLYSCPTDVKMSIVTSFSIVNTHSSAVIVNSYKTAQGGGKVLFSPKNFLLGIGYVAVYDEDITLSPGDTITATCSVSDVGQFVVNGNEFRD